MKFFKYILAAFAAAVLASLFFAVPVLGAAEGGRCYFITPEGDGLPGTDGVVLIPDGSVVYTVGSAEKAKRTEDGSVSVDLSEKGTPGRGDHEVARIYVTQTVDLSWVDTLALDLIFSPGEGSAIGRASFSVVLSAGGADSVKFSGTVAPGRPYTMIMDLSSYEKKAEITRVSATLEWESAGGDPGSFEIGRLLAVWGRDFGANDALAASSFSSDARESAVYGGTVAVLPEGDSAGFYIDFEDNAAKEARPGSVPVRYAALSTETASGTVAAEFTVGVGGSERVISFPARPVFPDGHVSLFRIEAEQIVSAAFTFRVSDGSGVTIRSFSIFEAGARDTALDEVGGVIECSGGDGEFRVEGRLKKSVAAEYAGRTFGLFTAPALGGGPALLATGRAGSAFSFSVPESSLPHRGLENYFWVSVLSDDGTEIPVTEKKFASTASVSEGYATVFGLHGADPAGVFEAGVKRVIVDVDVGEFAGDVAAGIAVRRDGETYFLKDGAVRKLDGETAFYEASGVGVYLRIIPPDPDALFPGDGSDRHALDFYLALVSFFCERYQNAASVVIPDLSPEDGEDAWERAENAALLARLTYGAAAEVTDSIIVTVPVTHGGTATREIFSSLLSEALSRVGQIPWSLLTDDSTPNTLDSCISSARANGVSSPSFSVIVSAPVGLSPDETAALFSSLCDRARTAGSRAVFLSLAECDVADYSILRPAPEEGEPFTVEADARDFSSVTGIAESRTLWDFSDSYSSEGWVRGVGVGFCGTVPDGDGRVLRFTLGDGERRGILLRQFADGLSFSQFPLVGFDLTVSSGSGAVISFVFGREDGRREYAVRFEPGTGSRSIVCDLGDWAVGGPVRMMAVLIRSDGETEVSLTRVTVHSRTANPSVPFAGTSARPADESRLSGGRRTAVYAVAVAAGLALILVAVFCVRSDRDSAAKRRLSQTEREHGGKS